MSNGNMLLGYARGKVGSLVFSRNKGKQVTAAYNGSPSNPRSESQMTQRASFLGVQKFYTKGRQAFFRFAFEDKKTKESEFAAFMRNNIKRGVMLSKEAFDNPTYPALGNFIMTKGSLGVLVPHTTNNVNEIVLDIPSMEPLLTFGTLSKAMIKDFGAQDGDILTVLIITANGSDPSNTPAVYPEDRQAISWNILQAKLDSKSMQPTTQVLGTNVTQIAKKMVINTFIFNQECCGVCVTLSRQTKRGLKVSTSYLCPNTYAQQAIDAARQQEYISAVLESWGSTEQAILQGKSDL